MGQNKSKIKQEKCLNLSSFSVLNCFKYFIFWDIFPRKLRQEKYLNYVKRVDIELRQNNIVFDLYQVFVSESLYVKSEWLDIRKDFLNMSSEKMFQYSQIIYTKSITQ